MKKTRARIQAAARMPAPARMLATAAVLTSIAAGAETGRHFDVSSGLSESTIKGIVQDRDGHMWFATQDGLNVYNGKTFKSYGCSYIPGRDASVPSVNLYAALLHEDGRRIWLASYDGVLLFDPSDESFTQIEATKGKVIGCMEYGDRGELWIGDNWGTVRYDIASGVAKQYAGSRTDAILHDSDDHIWTGSMDGISRLDRINDSFIPVDISGTDGRNHVISLLQDSEGRIWAGMWYNGLALYDIRTNSFRKVAPECSTVIPEVFRIRKIIEEKNEYLLLCTNAGLYRYNIASNRMTAVPLSDDSVKESTYTIFRDREKGLWIGTYYNGVYFLSQKFRGIERYSMDKVDARGATAFCEDSDGCIWVGSEHGGVSRFNPSAGTLEQVPFNIPGDNVHTIFRKGDCLYLGTFAEGLRKIDLKTGRMKVYREGPGSIPDNHIFFSGEMSDGSVALGTLKGACRFYPGSGTFKRVSALPDDAFIISICEDRNGNVWYADFYNGLYREDPGTGQWFHYTHSEEPGSIPDNKLLSLHCDAGGRLWICSNGSGIFEYDYADDCFKPFTITMNSEEVKLAIVCGAMSSADGKLWLSSFNGLYCCDILKGTARRITSRDGLQSNQFNFGSAFRSTSGSLYFGGINGFNVLSPDIFQNYSSIPRVTVAPSCDGSSFPRSSDDMEITIPRSTSSLSLELECLSYASNEPPVYLYTFDRGDEQRTGESVIAFANLPYGRHRILVRALSGDGTPSTNSVELSVKNLRPLFLSIAALVIYIFAFLALSVSVFLRTKTIRSKKEKDRVMDLLVNLHNKGKLIKRLSSADPAGQGWTEKLSDLVQKHVSESDLSVEELAEAMNMGRSAFQKKVKEESGLTPVEFIRLIRMKNAAELLSCGKYSVSEVSFMVGFNKPSYFSTCFRHQYGMLPKDYARKFSSHDSVK